MSSEKNILKKLCIKFYFVLKRRLFFPFWGICVGGCGRNPAECFVLAGVRILTPLFHHPPSNDAEHWAAFEAQQHHRLEIKWHWHSGVPDGIETIRSKQLGFDSSPLWRGGSFGGLLKMDQRRFFTAPRTPLLCLVVTQRQMVFLSFCKWSFWKNVLETGLLRWIWT